MSEQTDKKQVENRVGKRLSGEVRLSLSDYHNLLEEAVAAQSKREEFETVKQNVKKFMTFLRKEEWFSELMTRFNNEVKGVQMYLDDHGQIGMRLTSDDQ